MFTGIIEHLGVIKKILKNEKWSLEIQAESLKPTDLKTGDSIAVDGCCLTVVRTSGDTTQETNNAPAFSFIVDAVPETLSKTKISQYVLKTPVHLELALRFGDRLGGHLVQGHIDETGVILKRENFQDIVLLEIGVRPESISQMVLKGSVAVDGVSLTVNRLSSRSFGIDLIPHTLKATNFKNLDKGSLVNIETDIIGKHITQLIEPYKQKQFS